MALCWPSSLKGRLSSSGIFYWARLHLGLLGILEYLGACGFGGVVFYHLFPLDREKFLFSGSVDHSIKMWDMDTLKVVKSMPAHDNPVCTLTINSDKLYSGSLKSIKVWDIPTCKLVQELPTQNHWVRALVTSEKYLYSGSYQAVKVCRVMMVLESVQYLGYG